MMTVLEQFSLFQRMAGSIKADVEAGLNQKALGKIEILEGELGTLRKDYEVNVEENIEDSQSEIMPNPQEDVIDVIDNTSEAETID